MEITEALAMDIEKAKKHFGQLLEDQLLRIQKMKESEGWIDYSTIKPLIIGIVGGDGIGPYICGQAQKILEFLLKGEIDKGNVELRKIEGLTIDNRVKVNRAIPEEVLDEIKKCHLILKGPTTTPKKGDPWPNIESANVAMRRELDLFANVRPVKVPDKNIDWMFFRENNIGYAWFGQETDRYRSRLPLESKEMELWYKSGGVSVYKVN